MGREREGRHVPVIPALGRLGQADLFEFKNSEVCLSCSRSAKATSETLSQKNKRPSVPELKYLNSDVNLCYSEIAIRSPKQKTRHTL